MRKILAFLLLALSLQVRSQYKVMDRGEIRLPERLTRINSYSPTANFRTHCVRSLSNEEPLWIINGVVHEGPVKDLDPATIDSIWILKPAGTALFCSGTNRGIIVITTKKLRSPAIGKIRQGLSSTTSFKVYPNPLLSGYTLNVKVTGNNIGYLRVVSMSGITLLVKEVREEKDLKIQSESNWLAGTYFIQCLDKNKIPMETTRFIIK